MGAVKDELIKAKEDLRDDLENAFNKFADSLKGLATPDLIVDYLLEQVVQFELDYLLEQKDPGDIMDDSMDGDAASALASAGWGTDEDYGYFGGDE